MGDEWGEIIELGFEGLDRFADKYHDKVYNGAAKIHLPHAPWHAQRQQNQQPQQQRGRTGQQQQASQRGQQEGHRYGEREEQAGIRGAYGEDDPGDDRYSLAERRGGDGRGNSDGGVIYIRKRAIKNEPRPQPHPLYDDPDPRFAGMSGEELKYRGGNSGAAQQPQGVPQYFQAQRAVSQFYETRTVPIPSSPGHPLPPQYGPPQQAYAVQGHPNSYAYQQPSLAVINYPNPDADDKKKGKRPRPKKRASSYSPPPKPRLDSHRRARSKSPKRDHHTTAAVLGGLAGALLGGAARGGSAKGAIGGAVVGGLAARQADVWHDKRAEKKLEEAERRREKREQRRLEGTYAY